MCAGPMVGACPHGSGTLTAIRGTFEGSGQIVARLSGTAPEGLAGPFPGAFA